MTKRKIALFVLLPVIGLAVVEAGTASAHGWGWFGTKTPEEIASLHQTMFEHQAQLLGVTVEEVKNAWAQGKSISQLAQEKGITAEQLQAKLKEAKLQQMKTQLQTLVNRGIITQAQADQRLQFMQNRLQNMPGMMGKGFHHQWF